MAAVIVGHGPSVLMEPMGELIDAYDFVVRMKRCQETLKHPQHYGTRTDAVCGSWTIAAELKRIDAGEYWIFLDSRHDDVNDYQIERMAEHFAPRPMLLDREICATWNARYRDARTPFELHDQMETKRTSDDLGHTHMSAGLHALIYACRRFGEVHLVGFDNVMSGDFTWSVTRGPQWDKYPDHRWDVEREMVGRIANEYGALVGALIPEAACDS